VRIWAFTHRARKIEYKNHKGQVYAEEDEAVRAEKKDQDRYNRSR